MKVRGKYVSNAISIVKYCMKPRTTIDISRFTKIPSPSVYKYLESLVEAGLVRKYKSRRRDGRTGRLYNVYIAIYVLKENPYNRFIEASRDGRNGHY